MRVGFYYHPAGAITSAGVRVPRSVGTFVEELARQAGAVTYFVHPKQESEVEDFLVDDPRVKIVRLPRRRRAPIRTVFGGGDLKTMKAAGADIDILLVRGPTPLLPSIARSWRGPLAMLLVGEYARFASVRSVPWPTSRLVQWYGIAYQYLQRRSYRRALVMVISPHLAPPANNRRVVHTSSLSEADIPQIQPKLRRLEGRRAVVLYTGRVIEEKGLFEAVEAIASLRSQGFDLELRLAGWSDGTDALLQRRAAELGVADRLVFLGLLDKERLLDAYRSADIYISPTYHEGGLNRALHEAMAHGLPTVSTSVPGIVSWVESGEQLLLVPPRSSEKLAAAVRTILVDEALRSKLSAGAWEFAKGRSNESSVSLIVGTMQDWLVAETNSASPA